MVGTIAGFVLCCILRTQHSLCSILFVRYFEQLYTRRPGPGLGSALDDYMALEIKDLLGSKKISPLLKFICTKQKRWLQGDPIHSLISPLSEGLSFRSLKLGSRKLAALNGLNLISEIPSISSSKCYRGQIFPD